MKPVVYSVAQMQAEPHDVSTSIEKHRYIAQLAAGAGADIVVFPELSVTGYQREEARSRYFLPHDERLAPLRTVAVEQSILMVVGVPLMFESTLYIASLLLMPNGQELVYIKHYLHTGEEAVFSSRMDFHPSIEIGNEKLAFAICYDIEIEEHIRSVKSRQATAYVTSIFYSTTSIDSGKKRLIRIARAYGVDVLMANYVGHCWKMEAGGKSGMWASDGRVIGEAEANEECLLVAEKTPKNWRMRQRILL